MVALAPSRASRNEQCLQPTLMVVGIRRSTSPSQLHQLKASLRAGFHPYIDVLFMVPEGQGQIGCRRQPSEKVNNLSITEGTLSTTTCRGPSRYCHSGSNVAVRRRLMEKLNAGAMTWPRWRSSSIGSRSTWQGRGELSSSTSTHCIDRHGLSAALHPRSSDVGRVALSDEHHVRAVRNRVMHEARLLAVSRLVDFTSHVLECLE